MMMKMSKLKLLYQLSHNNENLENKLEHQLMTLDLINKYFFILLTLYNCSKLIIPLLNSIFLGVKHFSFIL